MHRQPAAAPIEHRNAAATTAAAAAVSPTTEKVDEQDGDLEEHFYEVNEPVKPRSWFRRHWFVITAISVGLVLAGILIGVVVVKVGILKGSQHDFYYPPEASVRILSYMA